MKPEIKIHNNSKSFEHYILAGDIGGTNTNMALMGADGENLSLLGDFTYPTAEISDFTDVVHHLKPLLAENWPKIEIRFCCIAAAGPIHDNACKLTNASWAIDGKLVTRQMGIPVRIINDFQAVCYGSTLLDPVNPEELIPLPRLNGYMPPISAHGLRCLAGAGTGMGVGFVVKDNHNVTAWPSEGGHVDFAPFDDESERLRLFIKEKIQKNPGAERVAAGPGMADLLRFFIHDQPDRDTPLLKKILASPEQDIPRLITSSRKESEECMHICRLFVRIYARFTANLCVTLLPKAGLFLAGGIAARMADVFLNDDLFIRTFELNHMDNIAEILKKIPVYIIKDYNISLYGSAVAALQEVT